jgi:uncharacterized delta-60 repeat protein
MASCATAFAAGALDPSFGHAGTVDAPLAAVLDDGSLAVRNDDRLLLPIEGFGVMSLTADGQPDPTFGNQGQVRLHGVDVAQASAVAVDAEGRVVIAGRRDIHLGRDVLLARLMPDGALDPSFGHGGEQLLPIPGASDNGTGDQVVRVLPLPDGLALATGNLYVARLQDDGKPTPTFGVSGIASLPDDARSAPEGGSTSVTDLAAQPDGSLLVLDTASLRRLLPSGALDSSFAGLPYCCDSVGTGLLVSSDARIVTVGGSSPCNDQFDQGNYSTAVLQRLLPNGSPDTSFGNRQLMTQAGLPGIPAGVASLPYNCAPAVSGVANPSGSYLVAHSAPGTLYRFTATGQEDATFGRCGAENVSGALNTVQAMIRQSSGRVILAGPAPNQPGANSLANIDDRLIAIRGDLSSVDPHGPPRLTSPDIPDQDIGVNAFTRRGLVIQLRTAEAARATLSVERPDHARFLPRIVAHASREVQPCRLTTIRIRLTPQVARAFRGHRGEFDGQLIVSMTNRAGHSQQDTGNVAMYRPDRLLN